MATKIRLQRHGKKGKPFYHIVIADARAPRDGKYIERIGSYNPNTNPATIEINHDRALHWVQTGAEATDTCRAMLSYTGVLHHDHLNRGVKKGAFSQDEADKRFAAWLEERNAKLNKHIEGITGKLDEERTAALKAEAEVSRKRAEAIAAKNAPEPEPEVEATEEAPAAEATTEEAPVAEAATEEAPAVEAKEETPAAKEDAPAAEEKKED